MQAIFNKKLKPINLNQGFSLIEIIISIAIISIIFALFSINFSFLNKLLLRTQVDKLFNTIVLLQKRAISTGKEQVLKFDIENSYYTFDSGSFNNSITRTNQNNSSNLNTCKLSNGIIFGYAQNVNGPPSSANSPIKSAVTFKQNKISFYSDGIIDAGTIYITDSKKQFLYAISCAVSKVSYVRKYWYDFEDNKWILTT